MFYFSILLATEITYDIKAGVTCNVVIAVAAAAEAIRVKSCITVWTVFTADRNVVVAPAGSLRRHGVSWML